ncbi:T9SS type A sorting domain-containing protein [Gaetbulibacter aestuarii]|uniref:T9SS type A sorting domain-containing protein n=1 Tax=Gaetbulibacter aestuarii TaxID=1502358 RepID=A0ABW7MZS3_9FLAO
MKKITFLLILLTAVFGFSQNLISNGDFETGDATGWSGYKNGTVSNTSYDVNIYGQWLGKIENSDGSLFQAVTVVPGETYNVSFDYLWVSNGNTSNMNVTVKDTPSGSGNNLTLSNSDTKYTLNSTNDTWFSGSFSFVATTSDARIVFFKGTNNNPFRLDNVVIENASSLSITDLEKFNFKSYPNPTTNYISLSAAKNIDKIEVYDLLGKQVLTKTIADTRDNVNVSNLAAGLYILKAYIEEAEGTFKFVKK